MVTQRSLRRFLAVSLVAGAESLGCGGLDPTDCATTATCAPPDDLGDAGAKPDSASEAAPSEAGHSEAGSRAIGQPCAADTECELGATCAGSHLCAAGCSPTHGCKGTEVCCGATCFDTESNPYHCGNCTTVCSAAKGTAACTKAECAVATCAAGFADCNTRYGDGCEAIDPGPPTIPVLRGPSNGTYTGAFRVSKSLKPTFRWNASTAGACGVTYEIQLDDSCTVPGFAGCVFPTPAVNAKDVTATTFTPDKPLPISTVQPAGTRYYWRVRACDGLKRCSDWSHVRYLEVGRLRDDINGDGYSDVVVANADADKHLGASIYFGGSPFNDQEDAWRLISQAGLEGRIAFAGDVNADGFADLLIGEPSKSEVRLWLGQAAPLPIQHAPTIAFQGNGQDDFGTEVGAAGDFNGDGFGDFFVGTFTGDTQRTYVYYGSFSPGPTSSQVLLSSDWGRAAAVGDADGDGYSDLFLVANDLNTLARGANEPDGSVVPSAATGSPIRWGDANGDGVDDVAFYATSSAEASITMLWGGADLENTTPSRVAGFPTLGSGPPENFRVVFAGASDLDGDGLPDLAAAANGAAQILLGAGTPRSSGPYPSYSRSDAKALGWEVVTGDYDGDGIADVLLIDPGTQVPDTGSAYIFFGDGSLSGTRQTRVPSPSEVTYWGLYVAH